MTGHLATSQVARRAERGGRIAVTGLFLADACGLIVVLAYCAFSLALGAHAR